MKHVLFAAACLAVSMPALADSVTFMRCHLTHPIYDAGLGVTLVRERVGSESAAILTHFTLGRSTQTVFENLSSRPELFEGDMAVGTIYESSTSEHSLQLTVHHSQADGNAVAPSTLVVDGTPYAMLCQTLMTVN